MNRRGGIFFVDKAGLRQRSSDLTRNSKAGKSVKKELRILETNAHGSNSKERTDYLIKIIAQFVNYLHKTNY